MIYLYGLFEGARDDLKEAISRLRGLQGDLCIAEMAPWSLVYSSHDDKEVLPKRRHMLTHTKVLEAMIDKGTVLPARFGLVADDLAHVKDLITAQAPLVAREFERVRGCVELGVRVSFPRQVALDATLAENAALRSERDALSKAGAEAHFAIAEFGGRLAEHLDRRRGAAQKALLNTLVSHVRDHVLRKPEEDTEVLRAEFLIPSDAQSAFTSTVEAAVSSLGFAPDAEPVIQIIGPVPMYNFVNLSLALVPDEEAA